MLSDFEEELFCDDNERRSIKENLCFLANVRIISTSGSENNLPKYADIKDAPAFKKAAGYQCSAFAYSGDGIVYKPHILCLLRRHGENSAWRRHGGMRQKKHCGIDMACRVDKRLRCDNELLRGCVIIRIQWPAADLCRDGKHAPCILSVLGISVVAAMWCRLC
ncbi:hypothetical protein NPIL_329071 [Nephila pilipes]|uniref:Uncharacterized protein n=1 Tax=Nephila pilipes TaxID=299642 RepID=A0A8X6UAX7_NEPPI|nr:hypothetical protein NPIL_329071 [Nephila pilipes]